METITQRFEAANDVHDLANFIYYSIPEVIEGLARSGKLVDHGIAAIPYETVNLENRLEKEELLRWEIDYITRAYKLAYQRWINGD